MLHPKVSCPDNLKIVLAGVLVIIEGRLERPEPFNGPDSQYICLILPDVGCGIDDAAANFIQECLGDSCSLGGWLVDNDPKYKDFQACDWVERTRYANKARVAWLKWLTQPQPQPEKAE